MAQSLLVLALSTKGMMDGRMSKLDRLLSIPFVRGLTVADSDTEKILRRLVGRKEVEDAVSRLDTLTKEENVMIAARNLEITHRVDGNAEATKVVTENIDGNVKATKDGAQGFLSVFIHALIPIASQQ
jgi:hypothetical protein